MKDRVVCIDDSRQRCNEIPKVVKGEIYTVKDIFNYFGQKLYRFIETGDDAGYNMECFRPVDETFGEVVCETIEQQIELEKVLI